jgi:hypothetical protein
MKSLKRKGLVSRSAFGIGTKYSNAVVGDEAKLVIDLDVAKQQ